MQKMRPEYAQEIFSGGWAFGNKFLSCHDDLLVVTYEDREYGETTYQGTQLDNGQFVLDSDGYVVFSRVKPVIDEDTRFRFVQ